MLNSKQRKYLYSLTNDMQPIVNIGKASLTPEIIASIDEALSARELIKISILKNCPDVTSTLAITMSERTQSEVVRIIGKKIILYRPAKKPKIVLPD